MAQIADIVNELRTNHATVIERIGNFDAMAHRAMRDMGIDLKMLSSKTSLVPYLAADIPEKVHLANYSLRCEYGIVWPNSTPEVFRNLDSIAVNIHIENSSFLHGVRKYGETYHIIERLTIPFADPDHGPALILYSSPCTTYGGQESSTIDRNSIVVVFSDGKAKRHLKHFDFGGRQYEVAESDSEYDIIIRPVPPAKKSNFYAVMDDMILGVNEAMHKVMRNPKEIKTLGKY